MTSSTSEAFFEAKYQAEADPWQFATNVYELNRYDRILQALGAARISLLHTSPVARSVSLPNGLPGSVIGLEACDISLTAVEHAQQRCGALRNVRIHHASVSDFCAA